MVSARTIIRDVDGDDFDVYSTEYSHRTGIVARVHDDRCGAYRDLDRPGAVSLIEALTAAVDAADMREAAEAERIAREECRRIREAAKLKRGDAVRLKNTMSRTLYTVVTDEDEDGHVDLVRIVSPLGAGRLVTGERAGQFERIPE